MLKLFQKATLIFLLTIAISGVVVNANSSYSEQLSEKLQNTVVLHIGQSKAFVNNNETFVDSTNKEVFPIIKDGRTLVPVRFISESLGAEVFWNESSSTVLIELNDSQVKLQIGSKKIIVNNEIMEIDVPAQIINERTFVPLRALVEALGKEVFWDDRGIIVISDYKELFDTSRDKELIDEISRTFEPIGTGNEKIVKVKREQSGLDIVEKLDFSKFQLNERINELLSDIKVYSDEDYKNGLIEDNDNIIISERFKEVIIQDINIGTEINDAVKILGTPSFTFEDSIYYKTKHYYLGFAGKKVIERAVITKTATQNYQNDILSIILSEIVDKPLIPLADIISNNQILAEFIEDQGFIHGGGWYAETLNGVSVIQFSDENSITIYNNFEGNLFEMLESSGYKLVFENKDYIVNKLTAILYNYKYINERFEKEGELSPNGKLKSIFDWINSERYYFTIRTIDNSKADYRVSAPAGQYKWIDDDYILFLNGWFSVPYILRVNDTNNVEDVNILDKIQFPDSVSNYFSIMDVDLAAKVITLMDNESKKIYKIEYVIDEQKNIDLKLVN